MGGRQITKRKNKPFRSSLLSFFCPWEAGNRCGSLTKGASKGQNNSMQFANFASLWNCDRSGRFTWITHFSKRQILPKATSLQVWNLQTGRPEQALHWTSGAWDSRSWTGQTDERASMAAGRRLHHRGSSTPQISERHPERGSCSSPLTGRPPSPGFSKEHRTNESSHRHDDYDCVCEQAEVGSSLRPPVSRFNEEQPWTPSDLDVRVSPHFSPIRPRIHDNCFSTISLQNLKNIDTISEIPL